MMPRVIAFVRLSTEEQANEGRAGLLRQREDISVACARYNLEVARTVELIGVSGTCTLEAPEFQQMLADLAFEDIDGVVVSAQDRLARPDTLGGMAVFDPFLRFKKLIWTPGNVIDLTEDSGFMITGIFALMAGMERKQILRRVATAKEEQRKRGRCANARITLPRGVDFDFKTGKWSWVEPWASRILTAYDLLLSGLSLRQIVAEIGGYSDRGLSIALRNPIWIGIRRYDQKRGEKYQSRNGRQVGRRKISRSEPLEVSIGLAPLVSPEIWMRAQKLLLNLTTTWNAKRSRPSRFLVGGLAQCLCGERIYTRGDQRKGKHDLYLCKSRHPRGVGCGARVLHREIVDSTLINFVTEFLSNAHSVKSVLAAAVAKQPAGERSPNVIERAKQELVKLQGQRARVIDLAARGLIDDSDLQQQTERISHEARIWQGNLERTAKCINPDSIPEIAAHIVTTLCEFQVLSHSDKRVVVRALMARVVVSDSGIESVALKLPSEVVDSRTRTDRDSSRRPASGVQEM
jgi:DNA invertase Pin-like site-specific DNA recombinase